jgi:CubicO group peptidase (beta-lactamase class C family)
MTIIRGGAAGRDHEANGRSRGSCSTSSLGVSSALVVRTSRQVRADAQNDLARDDVSRTSALSNWYHGQRRPMTSITTIRAACGSALMLFAYASACKAQAPSRLTTRPTHEYSKAIAAAHQIVVTAYERGLPAPTEAPFHGERVRPPALSVAIAVGGRVVYAEAFGFADLEQHVPATTSTKCRVGSISKSLTAAALGLLYQQGRLDLDAPVQQYVPSFPDKGVSVTAREIGGHLGGIRGYKPNEPESQAHYPSVDSSLSRFRDDSLVAEPGTRFVSTPTDLARFGIAMLHPGFLDAATLRVLETSQVTATGKPTQYGIGWFVSDSTRFIKQRTIRHSGGAVGSTANLLLYPDHDIVVAWAQNDGQLNDNDLVALADPFIRDRAVKRR